MKAEFEGYPINAEVNEVIHFTDLSQGGPYTLDWDFGDGTPHSNLRTPTHSYYSQGIYTVKLTITNEILSDTIEKKNYINVRYNRSGTGFVRESGPSLIFD